MGVLGGEKKVVKTKGRRYSRNIGEINEKLAK